MALAHWSSPGTARARPGPCPCAVEQYTLIGLGKAENVARLLGGQALHVAQRDHGALVLGQRRDRLLDRAPRLAGEQPLLGHASRRGRPVAIPREPVGVDRGVAPRRRRRRTTRTAGSAAPARPLVFALLVRIRNSHVFRDERPSKRSRPVRTASHVSATTSSAIARDGTYICATRRSEGPYLSTSAAKAGSSPARSGSRSAASSSGGSAVAVRRR